MGYGRGSSRHDKSERNALRAAGKFNAELLDYVRPFVKEGVTTAEIDRLVHMSTQSSTGMFPATLGYHDFPKSCCTSVNEVICHGIPRRLRAEIGRPRER